MKSDHFVKHPSLQVILYIFVALLHLFEGTSNFKAFASLRKSGEEQGELNMRRIYK